MEKLKNPWSLCLPLHLMYSRLHTTKPASSVSLSLEVVFFWHDYPLLVTQWDEGKNPIEGYILLRHWFSRFQQWKREKVRWELFLQMPITAQNSTEMSFLNHPLSASTFSDSLELLSSCHTKTGENSVPLEKSLSSLWFALFCSLNLFICSCLFPSASVCYSFAVHLLI